MPPPYGGMSTSTNAIVKAMEKFPEHIVEVVDISVRWRGPMNMNLAWRLVGGAIHAVKIMKEVRMKAAKMRPDMVEIANCGGIGPALRDYILLRQLKQRKIGTVLTFHTGRFPALFHRRGIESTLVSHACATATSTIVLDAPSEAALRRLPSRPWVERRSNFVDIGHIEMASLGLTRIDNSCDVLFVGWIGREKGIFELVNAVKELPGVTLKYVGPVEANVAKSILNMAGEARGRVEIVGPREPAEVFRIMAQAKIVALPSYTEAFPYVVLEAMTLRKPVIATGVAAIPEILELRGAAPCGREVAVRDVASLKSAILELASDATLRQTLGERGYARVHSHYVESAVMPHVIQHWRRVSAGGSLACNQP